MDVETKVLNVLKGSVEPLKGKQIAEAADVDKKDIDKSLKKLKKEGKIYSPKNCFYTVK